MSEITFIHAADLHLGALYKGLSNIDKERAQQLGETTINAFLKLVETAVNRKVNFVILAGDTFDRAKPSHAEFQRFVEGLKRLDEAGIPVYMVTGNHDPYKTWKDNLSKLPSNVHFFDTKQTSYALYQANGETVCVLAGRSYLNSVWPEGANVLDGMRRADLAAACQGETCNPFYVGVAHTGLKPNANYAPCSQADMEACGLDYWALGHMHKRISECNGTIVFSGCMQGHDINEEGVHGFNVVTLSHAKPVQSEFVPSAEIEWAWVNVNVADMHSLGEVTKAALYEIERTMEEKAYATLYVRVKLTGATSFYSSLRNEENLQEICERLNDNGAFYCDKVVNATRAPRDTGALKREGLFASHIIEQVEDPASQDRAKEVIKKAFSSIGVDSLEDIDIPDLITKASDEVLDMLVGGEE